MSKYPFLSDEWIEQSRKLRAEYAERIDPPAAASLRLNLVVEQMPFGETRMDAHLDTTGGEPEIELGHLDSADATVTADYALVKSIVVDGDMSAAMEAMQLGRIRIDGDIFKLMSLASLNADPGSIELAKAIRNITE